MSLTGQVESGVEIKASAATIHEIFSSRPQHLTKLCPKTITAVDLLEGDWGKPGCVIGWHLSLGEGKPYFSKEIIEEIDHENKSTIYKVIEGGLLENYKSLWVILKVTPKGEGSFVNWTYKYEKLNKNVPDPNIYLQMTISLTKDVDASLTMQA